MLHRGLRLCTLSSPPAKPTISRKGLGWKMFSAECRNTNWAKRTSRIFSLGTGHLPNAKVTRTDINLTQIRMQLTPHPCQLHLTLSICTSSDAYHTEVVFLCELDAGGTYCDSFREQIRLFTHRGHLEDSFGEQIEVFTHRKTSKVRFGE